MFERLSDRAIKVFAIANQEAIRFNHHYIGTEHILLGIVAEGEGKATLILKNLGIDLSTIRRAVERLLKAGPAMVSLGKLPQTPRAKKVVEYAIEECRYLRSGYVGTEHFLLGLLREGEGVAYQVLQLLGVTLDNARSEAAKLSDRNESHPAPFRMPVTLSLRPIPGNDGMACLLDDLENVVSSLMRIELAQEIVKRYNAQ